MVQYFLELALMDINCLKYPISKIVASSLYLLRKIRKTSPTWTT